MAGICKIKGKEKGLWFEIQCIQECIVLKEKNSHDASFEKQLLKSFKKYSEQDYIKPNGQA